MKQNLVTGKGETFTLNIEYKDSNDAPVDLTGHEVDFLYVERHDGVLIQSVPATVDEEGNISIKVTDEETDLWPLGVNAYRVVHTYPNGDEKWLLTGRLTVLSGADV